MKKVLVAEDEESIREFIVINLTRSGYTVEQAENGAVALEKFAKDESGFDVADPGHYDAGGGRFSCVQAATRQILRLGHHYAQRQDTGDGQNHRVDVRRHDYVTKPFSPSELMARRCRLSPGGDDPGLSQERHHRGHGCAGRV